MDARFFYAPHVYHQNGKETWAKLFVLTPDGTLYSEYLDYMKPATVNKKVNYQTFQATDYSYGQYQHMNEISYDEARRKGLTQQQNWIDRYLSRQGLK